MKTWHAAVSYPCESAVKNRQFLQCHQIVNDKCDEEEHERWALLRTETEDDPRSQYRRKGVFHSNFL